MSELLADEGVTVDAIYSSPVAGEHAISDRYNVGDAPEPSPAMIKRAAAELNLDLSKSYLIGDRSSDIVAAQAAGVRPILVAPATGGPQSKPGATILPAPSSMIWWPRQSRWSAANGSYRAREPRGHGWRRGVSLVARRRRIDPTAPHRSWHVRSLPAY
ncbi:hypothetical protein E1292_30420 [Nonomuraea deserti]|uniref:Uncharacterized protein n=1 Tax=Nonomuraea deserti TaxID=1848322 RepID=A0A4R4VD07_9ACTN|nr:HAD hydrolase-like protein [Nonomuraea deserti]TDC99873.1 hypothetical protein E1292_30420 [Nonomuraea deserti]